MGLESVRGPQSSSGTLALDTLVGFGLDTLLIVVYPTADCTRLIAVHMLAN